VLARPQRHAHPGQPVERHHWQSWAPRKKCHGARSRKRRISRTVRRPARPAVVLQRDGVLAVRLTIGARRLRRVGDRSVRRHGLSAVWWRSRSLGTITRNDGSGDVSDRRISRQLNVLNNAFTGATSTSAAATRFTFQTRRVIRTARTSWYNWANPSVDSSDETNAKRAAPRRHCRAQRLHRQPG
jgi:hypothetical protein